MAASGGAEGGNKAEEAIQQQEQSNNPYGSAPLPPPHYQPPASGPTGVSYPVMAPPQTSYSGTAAPVMIQPAVAQGFSFNAASQQMMPLIVPVAAENRSLNREPAEAAVARPLAIIGLFCYFQLWFSIPALVLAYKRNKAKSNYNVSIALSVTSIVIGLTASMLLMWAGIIYPITYY